MHGRNRSRLASCDRSHMLYPEEGQSSGPMTKPSMIDLGLVIHKKEPEKRVRCSRKRSGTHPAPGSPGEPMKQTNSETDEALAHIRRNTAVPIQRFFDSVVAARIEETTGRQIKSPVSSLALNFLSKAKGLRRFSEILTLFLKRAPGIQPVARGIRRIRRSKRAENEL